MDDLWTFRLELLSEEKRLSTFTSWVFDNDKPCSAEKLAEAGFYYTGSKHEPDAVQCFLCGKPLDGWEEDDDPWEEHLSHSKNCMFAKQRLTEGEMTYLQAQDLKKELCFALLKKAHEDSRELIISKYAKIQEELAQCRFK